MPETASIPGREPVSRRLGRWFYQLQGSRATTAATALAIGIALADYGTGWQLHFATFYFAPVWLAAWKVGLRPALAVALGCALARQVANRLAGEPITEPWLIIWNTASPFLMFAATAWLLSQLRATLARESLLARTDPLTGVLNRRAFLDELAAALARGQRLGLATGLVCLDLDRFKAVNDTHGHAAGDALLQLLARAARTALRAGDAAGRLGGDEFALVLSGSSPAELERAARRICGEIEEALAGCTTPCGMSAGAFLIEPNAGFTPTRALAAADQLLYRAKRQPRYDGPLIGSSSTLLQAAA